MQSLQASPMNVPRAAVFLDRDGVLIRDTDYVRTLEEVELIPGAAAAVRALNDAGFVVVVVTNQSGVARGIFDESLVHQVHELIVNQIQQEAEAYIDRFEYCPHHATHGLGEYLLDCECRKPKPGMLLRAATALNINLAQSWMVGDRRTDLEAGSAAGCKTILVRTGSPLAQRLDDPALNLISIEPSIHEAVAYILSHSASRHSDGA